MAQHLGMCHFAKAARNDIQESFSKESTYWLMKASEYHPIERGLGDIPIGRE